MSTTRQDPFVRLAQLVGDFGNPFYAEERQRDVWNEASAFGLQLAIWSALLAGTAAVWGLGEPAVPYVLGALLLVGLVCLATLAYAARLGVLLTTPERLLRWRLLPLLLLLLGLLLGVHRAGAAGLPRSFAVGMLVGAAAATGALAVAALRARSRAT